MKEAKEDYTYTHIHTPRRGYNFLYLFIYQLSATFNVIRRIMSLKLFTYAGNGLCPFTLNGSDNAS